LAEEAETHFRSVVTLRPHSGNDVALLSFAASKQVLLDVFGDSTQEFSARLAISQLRQKPDQTVWDLARELRRLLAVLSREPMSDGDQVFALTNALRPGLRRDFMVRGDAAGMANLGLGRTCL